MSGLRDVTLTAVKLPFRPVADISQTVKEWHVLYSAILQYGQSMALTSAEVKGFRVGGMCFFIIIISICLVAAP